MNKINFATIYFLFLSFFVMSISTILSIIVYILFLPLGKMRAQLPSHKVARLWGFFTMALVFPKINIEGIENYDKNKTYIITINHQSMFDILLFLKVLDGKYSFVAKDTLFKIPALGIGMKFAGYISVERGTIGALKSIDDMSDRLKNNWSVLIFPEGTRSYDGEIKFPKKGILKISERFEDIEILPIVCFGTKNIMRTKTLHTNLFQTINIRFLKAFKMKDIDGDNNEKLKYWYDIMCKNYNDIRM